MNDELKRYPYVFPSGRYEFRTFRWGFVLGLGTALVFVGAAWVFS